MQSLTPLPPSPGSRPFQSGGLTPWGSIAASFTTFWNLRAAGDGLIRVGPPGYDMGPNMNFVGMRFADDVTYNVDIAAANNWYREDVPAGAEQVPAELYSAMLQRRMQTQVGEPLRQPS